MNVDSVTIYIAIMAAILVIISTITTARRKSSSFMVLLITIGIVIIIFYLPILQRDNEANTLHKEYSELEEKYNFMIQEFDKLDGLLALRRYKEFDKDLEAIRSIIDELNKARIFSKDNEEYKEFQLRLDTFQTKYNNSGLTELIKDSNRINNLNNEFDNEVSTLKNLLEKKNIPRSEIDSTIVKLIKIKNELVEIK